MTKWGSRVVYLKAHKVVAKWRKYGLKKAMLMFSSLSIEMNSILNTLRYSLIVFFLGDKERRKKGQFLSLVC